jgi:hypothetical protein
MTKTEDLDGFCGVHLLWHFDPDGSCTTVAQRYLARFTSQEADWQAWYEAHRRSWLGIWEMRQVDPGRGTRMVDLLTGEERYVYERQATQQWNSFEACLARVVDLDEGLSVLAGTFPIALPPRAAEAARQKFLEHSFPDRRKLKPADLCSARRFVELANFWNGALLAWYQRPQPTMVNQDGDPTELCIDSFTFSPETRPALLTRLGTLGPLHDDGTTARIKLSRAPLAQQGMFETVTVGTIRVTADRCQAEANSVKRADHLQEQILACAGDLLQHRGRERKNIAQLSPEPRIPELQLGASVPKEVQEALNQQLRQLRQQHMKKWLDLPVPALLGKTPRQAARDTQGRKELQLLLKEFAFQEARTPTSQRISLDHLYHELGLGDGR